MKKRLFLILGLMVVTSSLLICSCAKKNNNKNSQSENHVMQVTRAAEPEEKQTGRSMSEKFSKVTSVNKSEHPESSSDQTEAESEEALVTEESEYAAPVSSVNKADAVNHVQTQYFLRMKKGTITQYRYTSIRPNTVLSYRMSDSSIAVVDEGGTITAKSAGRTALYVYYRNEIICIIYITVEDPDGNPDMLTASTNEVQTDTGSTDAARGEAFKRSLGNYVLLTDMWEITWGYVMITTDPENLWSCVAGEGGSYSTGTGVVTDSVNLMEMVVDYDWERTGDVYVHISSAVNPNQQLTIKNNEQCEGTELVFMPAYSPNAQTFAFDGCGDGFYIHSVNGLYLTDDNGTLRLTEDINKATKLTFFAVGLEDVSED